MTPAGVVIPRTREALIETVRLCKRHGMLPSRCAAEARRSAARRSATASSVRYFEVSQCVLEVNAAERWARVEPGIVLDELNAQLAPLGMRFAPDISTASRATDRRHDGEQFGRSAQS